VSASSAKRRDIEAMTSAAITSYDNPLTASIYLPTSNMDGAWRIGRWLKTEGKPRPTKVSPSKGNAFWVEFKDIPKVKVYVPWSRTLNPSLEPGAD